MGGADDGADTALGEADPVAVVAVDVDVVVDGEVVGAHGVEVAAAARARPV